MRATAAPAASKSRDAPSAALTFARNRCDSASQRRCLAFSQRSAAIAISAMHAATRPRTSVLFTA
ncbi:MAG TPA: hypothetical protein VF912_21920 [Anaeromyxobacter sp.]